MLRADTKCERYKVLFEPDRWKMIIDQFYEAMYRLNWLTSQSLLNIHLQAGVMIMSSTRVAFLSVCRPVGVEDASQL